MTLASWRLNEYVLGAEMRMRRHLRVPGTHAPSRNLCLFPHCRLSPEHLLFAGHCSTRCRIGVALFLMKLTVCVGRPTSKPGIRANRLLGAVQPENRAASLPRGQESLVHYGETCLAGSSPSNRQGTNGTGCVSFHRPYPSALTAT